MEWWWVEPGADFFVCFAFEVSAFLLFFFEAALGLAEGAGDEADGDGVPFPET